MFYFVLDPMAGDIGKICWAETTADISGKHRHLNSAANEHLKVRKKIELDLSSSGGVDL